MCTALLPSRVNPTAVNKYIRIDNQRQVMFIDLVRKKQNYRIKQSQVLLKFAPYRGGYRSEGRDETTTATFASADGP